MSKPKAWHGHREQLKYAEGGMAQTIVRCVASGIGVGVRFWPSPYVGHYTVEVDTRDKRKLARLDKELGWA